jgi:hypothetical protein
MNPHAFEVMPFALRVERDRNAFELEGEHESGSAPRPCTPPTHCEPPPGGNAPPEGQFSGLTRGGFRFYTPRHGDSRWALARQILLWLHDAGRGPMPTAEATLKLSRHIRDDPCNAHLRHRMFLPRFKSDRFTCRGSSYGAIFIRVKNLAVRPTA